MGQLGPMGPPVLCHGSQVAVTYGAVWAWVAAGGHTNMQAVGPLHVPLWGWLLPFVGPGEHCCCQGHVVPTCFIQSS